MASLSAAALARGADPRLLAGRIAPAATVILTVAVVALAANMATHRSPLDVAAIAACAVVLAILAVIDVHRRTIPNRIVLPALGIVFVAALVRAEQSVASTLAGATFAAAPFLVAFFVVARRVPKMGRGDRAPGRDRPSDVKWAGLAGAFAVLVAGLVQADQSAGSAAAAAVVAGSPFLMWPGRRSGVSEYRSRTAGTGVRGMGGGDVKLTALLGAIASVPGVFAALSVAVFGGACAAVTLLVLRRSRGAIPYGPFLAAGGVLTFL